MHLRPHHAKDVFRNLFTARLMEDSFLDKEKKNNDNNTLRRDTPSR